ncbi:F0F1 ATP synthase subunit A [Mesoplasma lactucae ATCC 49193]|uniref:F0F1 ATP synthase subunit A n=2 Tax=Mesoplasma lactucae TaxID=138853 RepID=A0A291ISX0_9MOLU|nr:F0F1 ATP synthase subunit A [Mesoplasma lactucae ATCC 49193]
MGSLGDTIKNNYNVWTPQFMSIIFTALIISLICLLYNVKIRNHDKNGGQMSGFLVLMEMYITFCENLVVSSMGKKYRKLTPYAMYITMYIFVSCILSLLGIESLATTYTVALSMALVTFFSIYYFGFKYQKWGYFKRYVNPIEILTQFSPLISLSFRLFGNMLGGAVILGLLYALFINIQAGFDGSGNVVGRIYNEVENANGDKVLYDQTWNYQYIYFWAGFNIFTTLFAPWIHMYFDLFDGGIQALVFAMLTFSYWQEAMGEDKEDDKAEALERDSTKKHKLGHKIGHKKDKAVQVAL